MLCRQWAHTGLKPIQLSSTNAPMPEGQAWHPALGSSHKNLFKVKTTLDQHWKTEEDLDPYPCHPPHPTQAHN